MTIPSLSGPHQPVVNRTGSTPSRSRHRDSEALRFGAVGPKQADGLYKLAEKFLAMHHHIPQAVAGKKGMWANLVRWSATNLFDHDYRASVYIPYLGRILAEPTIGAVGWSIIPAVLLTRSYVAVERAINHDYREVRDILIRDIPSMTILVYAQPVLMQKLTQWIQNHRGIQLLSDRGTGQPLSFSALTETYDIRHPDQLKRLMANRVNRKGTMAAIDAQLRNEVVKGNRMLVQPLRRLRQLLLTGFNRSSKAHFDADRDAHLLDGLAKEGFELVERLDKTRLALTQGAKRWPVASAGQTNPFLRKLAARDSRQLAKAVPEFSKLFSWYAVASRVQMSVITIGAIVGALGIAIPMFNKLFTEHEYRKLKATTVPVPTLPIHRPVSVNAAGWPVQSLATLNQAGLYSHAIPLAVAARGMGSDDGEDS